MAVRDAHLASRWASVLGAWRHVYCVTVGPTVWWKPWHDTVHRVEE